jgi:hypothetical protein
VQAVARLRGATPRLAHLAVASLGASRCTRKGFSGGTHCHWHLSQVAVVDTAGSVAGVSTVAMARSDESVVERGGSKVRRCRWLRRLRERSVTLFGVQRALACVRPVSRRTAHTREHDAWAWDSVRCLSLGFSYQARGENTERRGRPAIYLVAHDGG